MNKWTEAAKKRRAEMDLDREMAGDLRTLLDALPEGQRKHLLKDKACAAILNKYGITE